MRASKKCAVAGLTMAVVVCNLIMYVCVNNRMRFYFNFEAELNDPLTHIYGVELKYLIENACPRNTSTRAVWIVTSYEWNVHRRNALRKAYPAEVLADLGVYRVFLLGTHPPEDREQYAIVQINVEHENILFNDIVQGNFVEAYRNLTYKHIMGISWAINNCNASYIIKMDDDMAVDMDSLLGRIERLNGEFDFYGKIIAYGPVLRTPNKWCVTWEEYDRPTYPVYASGWCYVTKPDVAQGLLRALRRHRFFWIDDVFVTGILAEGRGLRYLGMPGVAAEPEHLKCCIEDRVDCEYIVGPTLDRIQLTIEFARHVELCKEQTCPKYPSGMVYNKSCVDYAKGLIQSTNIYLS